VAHFVAKTQIICDSIIPYAKQKKVLGITPNKLNIGILSMQFRVNNA
jgi:hypothetical protein